MSDFYSTPEHQPFVLGNGPVGVLLIHGFPGTPAEMRPLGERLAGAGMTAYGLLLPGFGPEIARLGETDRHIWLEAAASAWQQVRQQHNTAILAGFSMGGALAVHLAVQQPPDQLVLLAPFWKMSGWQARLLPLIKYVYRSIAPFKDADFSDPALRRQLANTMPHADLDDPEVQARIRKEVRLPTAVLDEVRRLGLSAYRHAARIDAPTLVVQGKQDETVTPAMSRRLVSQMQCQVTYQEVAAGHDLVKLNHAGSEQMLHAVLSFLPQLPVTNGKHRPTNGKVPHSEIRKLTK